MKALEVRDIDVFYGDVQAVWDVSFDVESGEIVTLVGANGAGKIDQPEAPSPGCCVPAAAPSSSRARTSPGCLPTGSSERGLVLVPEARQLWPGMTVLENLEMGAYGQAARAGRRRRSAAVLRDVPHPREAGAAERRHPLGGEQQMCAIGRGLMARPKLLLLDEPALGLSPLLVREVFAALRDINGRGVTLLLVEQNVHQALALARRGFVLETGHMTLSGNTRELLGDPRVKEKFLGEAAL